MKKPHIIILTISLLLVASSEAKFVYQNTFDYPDSLDAFHVLRDDSDSVAIEAGQLKIETGGALLALDASTSFDPTYNTVLSHNSNLIRWSFNVSHIPGDFNGNFHVVLASTKEDAFDIGAHGYTIRGGTYGDGRIHIRRFDYGLGGGGENIIDISDGIKALPEKGSINITYNPVNDEWSLYGEAGPDYTDPIMVNTLMGKAIDGTYTSDDTKYFGLLRRNVGTVYLDNVGVEVIPEPNSIALIMSFGILLKLSRRFLSV